MNHAVELYLIPGGERTRGTTPDARSVSDMSDQSTAYDPHWNPEDHGYRDNVAGRLSPMASTGALITPHLHDDETSSLHRAEVEISRPTKWVPVPLRTIALAFFAIIFVIIFATLEALFQVSQRHHGLSTSDSSKRYAWTYGPTAVLIVIAAFWGQVEYRIKQLMPWQIMSRGPASAENSVLLDYVSPWNVLALFKSLKNRHLLVSLVITASLLLKVAIIASTGLFMLQEVRITHESMPLGITDRFDSKAFSTSLDDSRSALTLMGVKRLGLQMPLGTTETLAVQSFMTSDPAQNPSSTVIAEVDTFFPDLNCEVAAITNSTVRCEQSRCPSLAYYFGLESPSCRVARAGPLDFAVNVDKNQNYGALLPAVNCSDSQEGTDAFRYIISTGYHKPSQNATTLEGGFTNLICKPTYHIQKQLIALRKDGAVDLASSNITPNRSPDAYTLPNVSAKDLATVIQKATHTASEPIKTFNSYNPMAKRSTIESRDAFVKRDEALSGWNWTTGQFDAFFLLLNATMPQSDPGAFTDSETLIQASQKVFRFMAAQIAKRNLMVPAEATLPGTAVGHEQRLIVRELSARIMEVCFLLLLIATGIIWWTAPRKVLPHDTSSLGGLAPVVAYSQGLKSKLRGEGASSLLHLRALLHSERYQTIRSRAYDDKQSVFSIAAVSREDGIQFDPPPSGVKERKRFWRPISYRWPSRISVICVPLIILIVLELLYQRSRANNGLATIIDPEGYVHYLWLYLPAVIMLALRTLYDMVDFSTRLLTPYYQMKKNPTPARRGILVNYLSKVTLHSLQNSILNRHWAVVATNLTMFLAPFLTILSSGLYFANPLGIHQTVPLKMVTAFNMSQDYSVKSANTATSLIANLIVKSNLSYPSWTYGDFVFPSFERPSLSNISVQNPAVQDDATLHVRVPALRASYNCTSTPDIYAAYRTYTSDGNNTGYKLTTALIGVPDGCGDDPAESHYYNNESFYPFQQTSAKYYAEGLWSDTIKNNSQKNTCAPLVGMYGKVSPDIWVRPNNDTIKLTGLHGYYCYPALYELQVDLTFALPNLTITAATPDESTAKVVPRSDKLHLNFFSLFPKRKEADVVMDGLWAAVIGDDDPEVMFSDANSDPWPRLYSRMQRLYRLVYAQALSQDGRIPAAPDSAPLTATVTLPSTGQARLMQDATSTRVLEAFLLAMVVCAVFAFFMLDTRELVAAEPCSIATMATLIVESQMVDQSLVGGSSGVYSTNYEGYLFSLGWWDRRGGSGKWFGVDVGRAAGV